MLCAMAEARVQMTAEEQLVQLSNVLKQLARELDVPYTTTVQTAQRCVKAVKEINPRSKEIGARSQNQIKRLKSQLAGRDRTIAELGAELQAVTAARDKALAG